MSYYTENCRDTAGIQKRLEFVKSLLNDIDQSQIHALELNWERYDVASSDDADNYVWLVVPKLKVTMK